MARKVRVGIDVRMIRHSGIGTYLANLVHELAKLVNSDFEMVLFGDPGSLRDWNSHFNVENFPQPIYSLSEQIGYQSRLPRVDLWHAPHYNIPLWCRSRLVVTIHDVIPWIFAGRFFSGAQKIYLSAMLARMARQARRIIAVSEHTKGDLVRYFRIPDERIRVIHEGVRSDFPGPGDTALAEKVRNRYRLPGEEGYLLYVGLLKPHKNLNVLLRVVKSLRRLGKLRQKLVIVGAKDRRYAGENRYLGDIATDADVIHIEHVESHELPAVYQGADAFILPSLYEGFGLTILEAFQCGTPVIASNRASIPEVAGDAALLFDAESETDLSKAILRLIGDPELRRSLVERGRLRAREFSWSKMASETLETYREVLNGR